MQKGKETFREEKKPSEIKKKHSERKRNMPREIKRNIPLENKHPC
jgi:hypothetical protein